MIRALARALGTSVVEFLRRAVRSARPTDSDKPWLKYIGMVESGDPDSSRSPQ